MLIALFCCLLAFSLFFLHDRKHVNVMINEQLAPSLLSLRSAASVSAAHVDTAPKTGLEAGPPASPNISLPATTKKTGTRFTLSRAGLGTLGSLRVRVKNVDTAKQTYDLDVMVGSRLAAHRRLKPSQPLWIAASHGKGSIEIVVDTLEKNSVSGYWIPSDRLAHVTPRTRRRHAG